MKDRIFNYQFSIFNRSITAKQVVTHPLFSGSSVMIVGSTFANFIAYIYHLISGRMLGPNAYGELAAILSIIGIVSVTFSFFGTVIIKFVSAADGTERSALFGWFEKRAFYFGLFIACVMLVIAKPIALFIRVDTANILLLSPLFLSAVLSLLYKSFLQGLLRFKETVISNNFDLIVRLILTILLIYLGYSVGGAVLAFVVSGILGIVLLRYYLRDVMKSKSKTPMLKGGEIAKYTVPILFSSLASTSIISIDIVLVKHFFDSYSAGLYASLATLGKIIFYGTTPVGAVMFPLISKRHAQGFGYKKILLISIAITVAISLIVSLIYLFVPELMISILFGNQYLEAAPQLFWFSIFISLYAISHLIVNYFFSVNRTIVAYYMIATASMQAVGIWLFHNSITQVIGVSILATLLLLVVLLINLYYEFAQIRA